ncbi:MAG TPA: S-adenosylmethionine:tRNA ribosyltransferase-isomerase, partial [Thermoleophilaceae bacterium]
MNTLESPARLEAREPPEERGRDRAEVALMVGGGHDGELVHARFRDLARFLVPGDLLVVNTSATLPAALPARLEAREPPEERGLDRAEVALMVASRHDTELVHARFR